MKRPILCTILFLTACATSPETGPASSNLQPEPSAVTATDQAVTWKTLTGEPPLIIAHRGASGTYPEHTIKAYKVAIEQGADLIEPDLVMTKDGVLVALHDAYLSETTNVADHPEFADRKVKRQTPLGEREDWWVDDFSYAEIKMLRARQRFAGRDQQFNDQFEIATFNEILDLVVMQAAVGRPIGLHIEAKWPSYFSSVGLDMVDPILEALDKKDIESLGAPVFIQCFEPEFLAQVAEKSDFQLIQNLVGPPYDALFGLDFELAEIPTDGVGANKTLILKEDASVSDYVDRAHAEGLFVHVFTVRDDQPAPGFETATDELNALFQAGVDAVWTDYPATAVQAKSNFSRTD